MLINYPGSFSVGSDLTLTGVGIALNVSPSPIRVARFSVRDLWSRVVFVLNPRISKFSGLIGFRLTKSCPRISTEALSGNPKLWGVKVLFFYLIPI